MKKNDLSVIIVAIIFSAVISVVASKFLFNNSARHQSVEVVPTISASFPTRLDKNYYNSSSIDPTQFISIGNGSNPNPFNGPGL